MDARDDLFDPMVDQAYAYLYEEGLDDDAAGERLRLQHRGVTTGITETGMAVKAARSRRHQEAMAGQLSFLAWLKAVRARPWKSGVGVRLLTLVTVLATVAIPLVVQHLGPRVRPDLLRSLLLGNLQVVTVLGGLAVFAVGAFVLYLSRHWLWQSRPSAAGGRTAPGTERTRPEVKMETRTIGSGDYLR